jgi:hypothetical protein
MKWLLDVLRGTWLGHPLHPILAHIPMAMWPSALSDLLSQRRSVAMPWSDCPSAVACFTMKESRQFNVQCPWHNSCFDIRIGKVTNGPAKVDLKTFKVEKRDGKIYVGVLGS